MTVLSVNLNKVALLRNQRDLDLPNVVHTGRICLEAGAHGLTIHPRPDQRHARPRDAHELAALIREERQARPGLELNIEGNPTTEFLALVRAVKPHQCTLVPDAPDARTSDNGWDVMRNGAYLRDIITMLHEERIRVSVFMNPDVEQIGQVPETGADRIELYTEPYARAWNTSSAEVVTRQYAESARTAQALGLSVNAGHDLNLQNLGNFCRKVPGILEVSIGHAITADALEMGWEAAVHAYLKVLQQAAR